MTQPRSFNQIIGNVTAIERIKSAITEHNGLGGCVFFLQGETGNGKTMLADIIADIADGDVYRPNCNDDEEVAKMLDIIKTFARTPSIFGGLSVFIFDECDRLSVENISNFKTAFDTIHRVKNTGKTPPVVIIFTTAKTKETVNPSFRQHWDELVTRCIPCKVGITKDELNNHFAQITGGAITDISRKINVQSVRAAWDYIKEHHLPITDITPAAEPFVLPESPKKRVEWAQTTTCSCKNKKKAPPTIRQHQNLIGIIRGIVAEAGTPVSYAAIRAELDTSGQYEFKRGVEGYYRTRQITSAVHNHIKKHGESALLQKTADGKVTIKN